jgi:hypothetical protein
MDLTSDGPYLQAACLCDRVLQEQDGVVTPVRLVDRVTIPRIPAGGIPPGAVSQLSLLIALKSGGVTGAHTVTIRHPPALQAPGEISPIPVVLQGAENGVNLIGLFQWIPRPTDEGLHWIDVLFDDRLLTRMPLRIVFQDSQGAAG